MGLLSLVRIEVGEVGVVPGSVKMVDTNNLATITAAGYLNGISSGSIISGVQLAPNDLIECLYSFNVSTGTGTFGWFQPSISNGVITLVGVSEGDIAMPTVANHIVYATDAAGGLSTANGANIINGGNIQAGLSGTAGYLASFPATLARGSLRVVGANSAGDTVTQITNASQAAARVYSIPDGGQAASNFLLSDSGGTQTIATGSISLTLGNITAAAGNIAATLGSVAAGTTVTGGTGVVATTGNVTASAGNVVAGATAAAGSVTSFAGTGANEFVRMAAINNTAGDFSVTISNAASIGQSQTISIPDSGAAAANFVISALTGAGVQHITSGSLQVDAGGLLAGLAAGGTAGSLTLYPPTTANGFLEILPINAGAAFNTIISNSVMGQTSTISIPDPGAATAKFLLDTGAANIIAKQQFVGIPDVLMFGTGTWTTTRIAQGNYVKRHSPADETSIIGVDITPMIVVAASKGFRLDSFDVIYAIAANALDAHSVTLDRIVYANNVAVSVTAVPVTATLATATQANPYVTNAVVDTPAFDITADSKYIIEVTVNNAAASEYDYYGIMLRFSQTIA